MYYRADFVVPLILFGFVLFCLASRICHLIKDIRRKSKPNLFGECIFFAIFVFLALVFAFHFGRGVSLAREKETDAVQTEGTVEEIKGMVFPEKYMVDGHTVWSKYIVIDGEKYYCMTGNFVQIGESVEITYLPKSKYILKIEKKTEEK